MRLLIAALITTLALASPALAHTGLGRHFAFADGLLHPLLGGDHLLALIGVGLWAGMAGGRARWVWPVVFGTMMTIGGLVALAGIDLWHAESMILVSLIGLSAVVGLGIQPSVVVGAIVCGLFAIAHGHTHGAELPVGASVMGYFAGFLTATAGLQLIGVSIGTAAKRSSRISQVMGAAIAAAGGVWALT